MKRVGLALVHILAGALALLPAVCWAGGTLSIVVSGGALSVAARGAVAGPVAAGALILGSSSRMRAFESAVFDGPAYLIVDATPADAQVFLDGRLLGTSGQLIARALPVAPGKHAIEIVTPGFRPYSAQFAVVPGGFPTRFRVALVPE